MGSKQPLEPESPPTDNEEMAKRQANDRCLNQSISYLERKGGEDSLSNYKLRVGIIHKYIVKDFAEKKYSFTPTLHKQLSTMVEEELSDFRRSEDQAANPPSETPASDNIRESIYEDILYGEDFDPYDDFDEDPEIKIIQTETAAPSYYTAKSRPPPSGMADAELTPRNKSLLRGNKGVLPGKRGALSSSKQWRYGGPNNEPEEYHKDYLPRFPYSETFHMQDWISEERERKPWSIVTDDPIMNNGSDCSKAEDLQKDSNDRVYESGSRFTFPKINKRKLEFFPEYLDNAVCDFNNGDAEEKKKKDYAPRIFLEKIKVHTDHSIRGEQKQTVKSHPNLPTGNKSIASRQANQATSSSSAHIPSKSSSRRAPSLRVMVLPKKATPRPEPQPRSTSQSRTRRHGGQIGYSRGEPTTPTPLTTRSKRKVVGSDIQGPGKKAKTAAKEVEFSTKVHYYDSDELYVDSPPSSTNTSVSNAKRIGKSMNTVKVTFNPALLKNTKAPRSPAMETVRRKGNVSNAAGGHDTPNRGSTRSGLNFRK